MRIETVISRGVIALGMAGVFFGPDILKKVDHLYVIFCGMTLVMVGGFYLIADAIKALTESVQASQKK